MIDGLHDNPELRDRQYQYLIARLAFRAHVLEQALRAIYTFKLPKTKDELANAMLSLETSLAQANDPGAVQAFAASQPDLLPVSMRASVV